MTQSTANPFVGSFLSADEMAVSQRYLIDGYVIDYASDMSALSNMRDCIAQAAAQHLNIALPSDRDYFLNHIHDHVSPSQLNDLRLAVIQYVNGQPWFRQHYYAAGRSLLSTIVGNELVMQRRLNLSIQLPNDSSSLLPVHADVWSGDSPYEAVMWMPLVNCFKTKSMYITSPEKNHAVQARFSDFKTQNAEDLFRAIEPGVTYIDIQFGQVLLFNHNLMHGNRVNQEAETRWSLNCRFKSVFSPYSDKRLGEFFEPITLRAATRIGMNYTLPTGFEE